MFATMQTVLTAYFTVAASETCAKLRLTGDNDPGITITLLHEFSTFHRHVLNTPEEREKGYAIAMDFRGDEASPLIEVSDKDVLVLFVRKYGSIIGSQVYEVDLMLPFSQGYLLIPRGGYNVLVDQENITVQEQEQRTVLTIAGPISVS